MKVYCNTCGWTGDDSNFEEPFGLSGIEPGCPSCGGTDFSESKAIHSVENDE